MDSTPAPPKVFANHVLKQLIQHLFGEDMIVRYEDYQALRVVFRHCGGSWASIEAGDLINFELLKKVVSSWGKMPERIRSSDRVI
jgi:hypothetical protein